jgi:hypothetical protein
MKNQQRLALSRRRLLALAMVAAAGMAPGCGEPAVIQAEKSSSRTGTRNRLEKFKENAQSALAGQKKG